ncbi:phytanoyl-CoA dioxygenase family protein [Mycobacterium sp. 21AC1]|uniref:mitomycin antibiotics/polyketide fumonisin biosynthesis protein n=1 Tax=[Mycobacterium] appelbergii TaxID=2939269 RepID=UPI002938FE57|nr:mitomycin antibiotics/polyketide fumonisin biosynthesis protein [Mycobacterium sp. 21AC1]MDV3127618.1 phytanoyl-CoA dioxygenase family protein [Mycobacterium sp. 21AC1]
MVDVDAFVRDGFVKVEQPDCREIADAARALLWQQIGLSPDDVASWIQPVVWVSDLTGEGPFGQLANNTRLASALDQLCGVDGWLPRHALGNIPVRFPVRPAAADRGWHIDLNTPLSGDRWAISGRPHTMLVLTLLSEVGSHDAATRIRVGSHRDVADVLGADAVEFADAGPLVDHASAGRPVAAATGLPGDLYLVHPFTVHAADEHRGATPRFMSQAPIVLAEPLRPHSGSVLSESCWSS